MKSGGGVTQADKTATRARGVECCRHKEEGFNIFGYKQADVLYPYAYLILVPEISSLSVRTVPKLFWPLSVEKTTW